MIVSTYVHIPTDKDNVVYQLTVPKNKCHLLFNIMYGIIYTHAHTHCLTVYTSVHTYYQLLKTSLMMSCVTMGPM